MINRDLCESVQGAPPGANIRRWTLRNDNHSHYHNVVNISESPLYLELSWRQTATDPVRRVGIFRLNLLGLLQSGYIRWEPVNSSGPEARLRIVRAVDGQFYVQVNQKGLRILLV
jgi:hypothetical protein